MDAIEAGQVLGSRLAEAHLRQDGRPWARGQALRDYAVGDWFNAGKQLAEGDDNAAAFERAYEEAYERHGTRSP